MLYFIKGLFIYDYIVFVGFLETVTKSTAVFEDAIFQILATHVICCAK